jgi:hypothetical protein
MDESNIRLLPQRDDGEQFFRRICVRELPVSDLNI